MKNLEYHLAILGLKFNKAWGPESQKDQASERSRLWVLTNPGRKRAGDKQRWLKLQETPEKKLEYLEKRREYERLRRMKNPEGEREENRRSQLNCYNLTPEQYDEMLTAQGGVCWSCKLPPGKLRLSIDHDHTCCPGRRSCGKCIRGLLCNRCNRVLGHCNDSQLLLKELIAYLEHFTVPLASVYSPK